LPPVQGFTHSSKSISCFSRKPESLKSLPNIVPIIHVSHTRLLLSQTESEHKSEHNPFSIYKSYLSRLWDETSVEARRKISRDKTRTAIKKVQETLKSEDYTYENGSKLQFIEARKHVLDSCDQMLDVMTTSSDRNKVLIADSIASEPKTIHDGKDGVSSQNEISHEQIQDMSGHSTVSQSRSIEASSVPIEKKKKKPSRSILFGATMGAIVACWVFSGNYIFTGLFTLMTALGQLEYYRMVMNTGNYPARKISVVGACAMFVTALYAPNLHQIVLPVFATLAMMWFLTIRRQATSIADIATTFTGMFYLGYIPSFWVRTRIIGHAGTTRLAPIVKPILDSIQQISGKDFIPNFIPNSVHFPITEGSIFIFWTWLCIAFSDVGAYFSGRRFGKTKLGKISPAAGATSPNKTVEGAIGGCLVSAALATIGAWVMKWPLWYITGPLHGINLGILGLVGDLTASTLKRDAGLKDFGDLIPEHGGIMDRVDSFVFNAPYSWLVCAYAIPWLKKVFI